MLRCEIHTCFDVKRHIFGKACMPSSLISGNVLYRAKLMPYKFDIDPPAMKKDKYLTYGISI